MTQALNSKRCVVGRGPSSNDGPCVPSVIVRERPSTTQALNSKRCVVGRGPSNSAAGFAPSAACGRARYSRDFFSKIWIAHQDHSARCSTRWRNATV